MDLSQYDALKQAYYDANPYKGDVSQYYGADALVGGWGNEADMAATNRPQDEWNDSTYQNWLGTLSPEQQAEYRQLHSEQYNKQNRMKQMAFLAAAGAMAAPGLMGAMGGEIAGGTGAAGLDAVTAADIAGGLVPEFGTSAAYSAIPGLEGMAGGTLASSTGSLWNSIPDYLKSLGGNAIKNVGGNFLSQLISSGVNAYMGNKQAGNYQRVIDEINSLYSPDSAYAKQMEQALARKDAAAGRNSQYGTRAVELAAALTKDKANALTSTGYGNLLGQRGINQNIPWNGFLAALGSGAGQDLITKAGSGLGGWLSGMYGSSGNKYSPTTPNTSGSSNWWNQVFADGGP